MAGHQRNISSLIWRPIIVTLITVLLKKKHTYKSQKSKIQSKIQKGVAFITNKYIRGYNDVSGGTGATQFVDGPGIEESVTYQSHDQCHRYTITQQSCHRGRVVKTANSPTCQNMYRVHLQRDCLQCFDAVGWVSGRASDP